MTVDERIPAPHSLALLCLGLLSLLDRMEKEVARPSAGRNAPLADEDPLVLAALGAISFGATLRHWLELAEAVESRAPEEGPPALTRREILR